MTLLPPTLGGAPSQPLDVGRATRVISPAQRAALAVRDRGCVYPNCDRPLAWCDAHHLWHRIDDGPTNLENLAMVCRAHHRTVHEGGWPLTRDPTAGSPPPPAGHPTAATGDDDLLGRLTRPDRTLGSDGRMGARPTMVTTVPGDCMGPDRPDPPPCLT
jgi:hypothetical protein